jgi:hypothetical protein
MCRLYSIPEPTNKGLVATEYVCGTLQGNKKKEAPMDKKLERATQATRNWLNKRHMLIICLLSVVHIGISCIQTRDSGTAETQ